MTSINMPAVPAELNTSNRPAVEIGVVTAFGVGG